MMTESCFKGRVVLITGGSSGIGAATAKQFAARGASLAITGRVLENLEKVAEDCRALGAKDVLTVPAEFSKLEDIKNALDKTVQNFMRLDILVNNVGTVKDTTLENTKMEDFDTIFDINVKSSLYLTQLAMPYLLKTKGNVVNVSSFSSIRQTHNRLVYGMSKAALDQFTKTIALEYAPKGVRVNSVNPAFVRTSLNRARGYSEEEAAEFYKRADKWHPMGRVGTADEIANAILFLASDASAWTTGQCMVIDGGRSVTVEQHH